MFMVRSVESAGSSFFDIGKDEFSRSNSPCFRSECISSFYTRSFNLAEETRCDSSFIYGRYAYDFLASYIFNLKLSLGEGPVNFYRCNLRTEIMTTSSTVMTE